MTSYVVLNVLFITLRKHRAQFVLLFGGINIWKVKAMFTSSLHVVYIYIFVMKEDQ